MSAPSLIGREPPAAAKMAGMAQVILFLAASAALLACGGSSGAYANVPYCADGNRARGCIGEQICSVTSANCQVCHCEGLE